MDLFIQISQLLLSLSLLIALHELGHFIPARLFKTRVEKFYLFFDFLFPFPNILPFSLFKFKKGDTEYGLGWFPFGGYVKIAGMIDESMDKDAMAKEPEPWEFRSKPTWQRLIIMLGGIIVNAFLAFLIYSAVLFTWGKTYLPVDNMTDGIYCDSSLIELGFRNGDKFIAMDGKPIPELHDYRKITIDMISGNVGTYTVDRGGQQVDIPFPESYGDTMVANGIRQPLMPMVPFKVDSVKPGSGAEQADLKKGDQIIGINGQSIPYYQLLRLELNKYKDESVTISVVRDGVPLEVPVLLDSLGNMGVFAVSPNKLLEFETKEYSFTEAIPAGYNETVEVLQFYIVQFKFLFSAAGVKQLGGFGTISKLFGYEWDWEAFWRTTAFISIILAFMNLLPIPALDGGHVMFLTYELLTGRKPNEKLMEYAQIAGMIFLLVFMLYANGMDIVRGCSSG